MHFIENGITRTCNPRTALADLICDAREADDVPVALAMVNNKLRELHHTVEDGSEVSFVSVDDGIGYEAYRRSCSMLFFAALQNVLGADRGRAVMRFSLGTGFYYTLHKGVAVDDGLVQRVKEEMHRLVDARLPITKRSVSTAKAARLFKNAGMEDKAQLFRTRIASRTNIYRIGNYEDYYYGFMVHNTEALRQFDLIRYRDGIVLQMPSKGKWGSIPKLEVSDKVFDARIQGEEWAEKLKIACVGDLNNMVIRGEMNSVVLVSEALQEGAISDIAAKIAQRPSVKFVMIAGPSSSGKTTFSQRLAVQLSAKGVRPHFLGIDNYFIDRSEMKPGPDGKLDFESLDALDLDQFNEDMGMLLEGKTIQVPTFDFVTGKRIYTGDTMSLGEDEVLIIEGLHALNDNLSPALPSDSKFGIYISALTQLNIDEHNRVPSGDGRLIRRIVRDNRTRGYSATHTLRMWDSVRHGEEKYIFPFQDTADVIFNSALPYEIAALKTYVQPLLFQVEEDDPAWYEAHRLLKFLDYFIAIPSEDVPKNSLLREFLGGGCFRL